jgi:hypothetical protein
MSATTPTKGPPVHEAERAIWQRLLALGHTALEQFFALQGTGDRGQALTLPDGRTCERLAELHRRLQVACDEAAEAGEELLRTVSLADLLHGG